MDVRITGEAFDAREELGAFLDSLGGEGAVVSFVGVARGTSRSGERVIRLFLDHHPTLSVRSVREIAQDARQRFAAVSTIRVVHRYGEVHPGETIVFVAAASPHRRAAFEAADYLMDRLKTDAVFWKREDSAGHSHWIEPTPADYVDVARWNA